MTFSQTRVVLKSVFVLAMALGSVNSFGEEKSPLESYRIDTHYGPRVSVLKSIYEKEGKFQFRLGGAYSPYSSLYGSYGASVSGNYFWNREWGWEIFNASYFKTYLSDFLQNSGFDGVRATQQIEVPKWRVASGVVWSPMYAKMHITDSTMLHFDLIAGLGLGWAQNAQLNLRGETVQNKNSYGGLLKTGFRFWLPPRFTLEIELEDFISSMQNFSQTSLQHNLGMNLSLGLFFGSFN
jgi:outer membrane beta-barrel protein